MRLVALVFAVLAWLAPACTALAADHVAPPGNSGVNEYVETLPSSSGNGPVGPSSSGGPSSPRGALDRGTAHKLRASGVDGRAAAQVLAASAPARASQPNRRPASAGARAGHTTSGHAPAPVGGDSKGVTLLKAATGTVDGGIGLVLPVVLVGTLVAAGAFALVARRWRTG